MTHTGVANSPLTFYFDFEHAEQAKWSEGQQARKRGCVDGLGTIIASTLSASMLLALVALLISL